MLHGEIREEIKSEGEEVEKKMDSTKNAKRFWEESSAAGRTAVETSHSLPRSCPRNFKIYPF